MGAGIKLLLPWSLVTGLLLGWGFVGWGLGRGRAWCLQGWGWNMSDRRMGWGLVSGLVQGGVELDGGGFRKEWKMSGGRGRSCVVIEFL